MPAPDALLTAPQLCWKQYRWDTKLQPFAANRVHAMSLLEALPQSPPTLAALVLQFKHWAGVEPPGELSGRVYVQVKGVEPITPPLSVTLIGASSVPSVRSVKLAATVVPLTN